MATNIQVASTYQPIRACIEKRINEIATANTSLRILEAGCGQRWPVKLDGLSYHLTGIDIDEDALNIRINEVKDLDKAIVGDVRVSELEPASFDVIYSSFVLEHIEDAEKALDNFMRWLKPGGLMILQFPDRDSVYGFITRVTPFWFHVWYKKYLMGEKNAGKPGYSPYPTYHESIISRQVFNKWIAQQELSKLEEIGFGSLPKYQQLFSRFVELLSFGTLTSDYRNLLYVLRK